MRQRGCVLGHSERNLGAWRAKSRSMAHTHYGNHVERMEITKNVETDRLEEEEEIHFSKQKHIVQSVVCLNTSISNNKKILHYSIKEYLLQIQYTYIAICI